MGKGRNGGLIAAILGSDLLSPSPLPLPLPPPKKEKSDYNHPLISPAIILSHAPTTSATRPKTAAQSTRALPSPTRSHTPSAQALVSSSSLACSSASRRWPVSLTSRTVKQPNRMASSTVGSAAEERSASSSDQNSVVSAGSGSVLGPAAWRSSESVLMNSGSRGADVCGVRVPL